jgi:acyl carrier protein
LNEKEIFEQLAQILADYLRLRPDDVTWKSHVVDDLGADSLALVELGFKFMEAFHIEMIDPTPPLLVVGNLATHIANLNHSRGTS